MTLILRPRLANLDGPSLRDPDLTEDGLKPRKLRKLSPLKPRKLKPSLKPSLKLNLRPSLRANLKASLTPDLLEVKRVKEVKSLNGLRRLREPKDTDLVEKSLKNGLEKELKKPEAPEDTETPDLMTQTSHLMNLEEREDTEDLTAIPMNGVADQDLTDQTAILMNGAEEDQTTDRVRARATAKNMGNGPQRSGPTKVGEGERKVGVVVVNKVVGATKTGPERLVVAKVVRLMKIGAPIP